MKKSRIIQLTAILLVSLTSSLVPIYAEISPKYIVHVQIEVRNAQEQLISITESRLGEHMQHKIPEYVFDSTVSKKEVIIIDDIKYEKIQFEISSTNSDTLDFFPVREYGKNLQYSICGFTEHDELDCISLQSSRFFILTESNDITTTKWTILRVVN